MASASISQRLQRSKRPFHIHDIHCGQLVLREYGGKGGNKYMRRFYSIWCNMRTRTTNENYEKWHRYGGRGINSDDFDCFIKFYDSMFDSFITHCHNYGLEETTLDRINNNRSYTPSNCKWSTWDEQCKNKCCLIHITAYNIRECVTCSWINLKEFCDIHGIPYKHIISQRFQKTNKIVCNYDNWIIKCND